MMRAASARVHETVADVYPYLAGQTGLGALFVPAWAMAGGREEMLKRFQEPELRPRIAREIEAAIEARVLTPENIDIPARQHRFTDYMREMNAGPGETMIRILEKEQPPAILKFGAEADLVELQCGGLRLRRGRSASRNASAVFRHVPARFGTLRARDEGADAIRCRA